MTSSSEQPPKYCNHEVVCRHHFPSDYAARIPCKDTCKHDTRPHPLPAQGFLESFNAGQISIAEKIPAIQAEAARKAREDVLQEGIALVQKRIDGIFEAYRGEEAENITARSFAAADGMDEAIKMLKSLRTTPPQSGQEQPR